MIRATKQISYDLSSIRGHRIKQLRPYNYFLNATYPPVGFFTIKSNNDFRFQNPKQLIQKMVLRNGRIKMNTNVFHKIYKSRILMLDFIKEEEKQFFEIQTKKFLNQLTVFPFDYKHSDFFQQQAIIKMIDVFDNYQNFAEMQLKCMCDFLLHLIYQNQNLQQKLKWIKSQFEENVVSYNEKSYYKANGGFLNQNLAIQTDYPQKLIDYMDRPIMFTRQYNIHIKRKIRDPIAPKDFPKLFNVVFVNQHRQDLQIIYQKEKLLFENSKISRLDFLSAVQFILRSGYTNKYLINKFQKYLIQDVSFLKIQSTNQISSIRFLEVMMICRTLSLVLSKNESFSLKALKMEDLEKYYQEYSSRYLTFLSQIDEKTLLQLVGSRLFPKFVLFNIHRSCSNEDLKKGYLCVTEMIFDSYHNGLIFYEQVDFTILLQLLFILFSKNQTQMIFPLLEKYQYILLFDTTKGQRLDPSKYMAVYSLFMKHQLRSDVLAQNLYYFLDLQSSLNQLKNSNKRKLQEKQNQTQLQTIFHCYLYLSLIQTTSQASIHVQQFIVSKLNVDLLNNIKFTKNIIDVSEFSPKDIEQQRYFDDYSKMMVNQVKKIDQKSQYKKNYKNMMIYKVNQLIFMIRKGFQIVKGQHQDKKQQSQTRLNKLLSQLFQSKTIKQVITLNISYPGLLATLCQLALNQSSNSKFKIEVYKLASKGYDLLIKKNDYYIQRKQFQFYYQQFGSEIKHFHSGFQDYVVMFFLKNLNKVMSFQLLESYINSFNQQFNKEQNIQLYLTAMKQIHIHLDRLRKDSSSIGNKRLSRRRIFKNKQIENDKQPPLASPLKRQTATFQPIELNLQLKKQQYHDLAKTKQYQNLNFGESDEKQKDNADLKTNKLFKNASSVKNVQIQVIKKQLVHKGLQRNLFINQKTKRRRDSLQKQFLNKSKERAFFKLKNQLSPQNKQNKMEKQRNNRKNKSKSQSHRSSSIRAQNKDIHSQNNKSSKSLVRKFLKNHAKPFEKEQEQLKRNKLFKFKQTQQPSISKLIQTKYEKQIRSVENKGRKQKQKKQKNKNDVKIQPFKSTLLHKKDMH